MDIDARVLQRGWWGVGVVGLGVRDILSGRGCWSLGVEAWLSRRGCLEGCWDVDVEAWVLGRRCGGDGCQGVDVEVIGDGAWMLGVWVYGRGGSV